MKKKLVLSALILLVGSSLFITRKENFNKEVTVEDLEKNKSIAIYIKDENGNYNKTNSIPTSGYTLNTTKSVCTNNAKPSWNIKTNSLKISNLTSKDTGCYLYFDEATTKDLILGNATSIKESPEGFTDIADTDEGMFYAEDDDGTTYYYRGAVENNWFKFAGFYWKIIRINGDGSIRLIYNGPTTDQTGETTQIGTKAFNSSYNSAEYVGIKYTMGSQHGTDVNSTILGESDSTDITTLNGWYNSKIKGTRYENYVETNGKFCSDRNVVSGYSDYPGTTGTGTTPTVFAPADRVAFNPFKTEDTPTLKCSNINDRLNMPIGLITSDEVIFSGYKSKKSNSKSYLFTDQSYWTMSPSYVGTNGYATVFIVGNSNIVFNLGVGWHVDSIRGVRPVINISPDVKLIGDGTSSNPYQIEGVE